MKHYLMTSLLGTALFTATPGPARAGDARVRLMTLDPGHFHAGLVQKFMYPEVSPVVHVYAPAGPELQDHLKRIEGFNTRAENPTRWDERVYTGPDFLERMLRDKPGNVVILSGNNARKTEYIARSVDAGLNVLADKPMAINPAHFKVLRQAFDTAAKRKVLLYDIMTERYEITTILQRELACVPEVFGVLEKGAPNDPAVVMESVHYYAKEVAGKPLVRPPWFFDVEQQGEAVPDVGTHLVDLVQWVCFPDRVLNWKKDIKVLSANRSPTKMTREQFKRVTGMDDFPAYLEKDLGPDGTLPVYQIGDVSYTLRGVHARVGVSWKYEAPPGTKDTHYSMVRGTRATLEIKQGAEQKFLPVLYVQPRPGASEPLEKALRDAVARLAKDWPGIDVKRLESSWQVTIPEKYSVGHEAHFTSVTAKYLDFLARGKMPGWEVPNMIAKYYTTTEAYRLGRAKQAKSAGSRG